MWKNQTLTPEHAATMNMASIHKHYVYGYSTAQILVIMMKYGVEYTFNEDTATCVQTLACTYTPSL